MRLIGFGFQIKVVVGTVAQESVEFVETSFEWMVFWIETEVPFAEYACSITGILFPVLKL